VLSSFKKIDAFILKTTVIRVVFNIKASIFCLVITISTALFLIGYNNLIEDSPPPQIEKISRSPSLSYRNRDPSFFIPLDAWNDLGKPLFDIDTYSDRFYTHPSDTFEITNKLKNKAGKFLQALTPSDFITLYQDVLHPSLTKEDNSSFRQQRIMYKD
jgi:hypothetical protein